MTETFDAIVIGSGHNGLIAGAYLAKSGQSVLILERNPHFGGGVWTAEVTTPGFRHDMHSMGHLGILANPLIKKDELKLQAKFGLKYIKPVADYSTTYPDGSVMISYRDLDRTIESIAAISPKDADAYKHLAKQSMDFLPMIIESLFVPPPPFGAFMAMMDQSPMGRNLIQTMQRSVVDILDEWFEHDKIKVHFMRLCSEHFIDPEGKGDGAMMFMFPALQHTYGLNCPEGGSGSLVDSLVRCLEDHGAELRANTDVAKVIVEKGKAIGVRLANGTDIRAKNCIVGQIHPRNLPSMVDGLDEQTRYEVSRVKVSSYCA
jgi:phytoene dehydrogenase-like protein